MTRCWNPACLDWNIGCTTLRAVISWGRYAEAFAYHDHDQTFSLENPT